MTIIREKGARLGMPMVAAVAVLLVGCGTHRPADDAGAVGPSRTTRPTPSTPVDYRCPGEKTAPTPSVTASSTVAATPPADHYAENHGFMVPFPLHGRQRCDGLAAVRRVENALEPLRERGDFTPDSADHALTGLGYAPGRVRAYQIGPTGVGFVIDASPLCVEGTMGPESTQADAFGGYPDHTGCERPSGGH